MAGVFRDPERARAEVLTALDDSIQALEQELDRGLREVRQMEDALWRLGPRRPSWAEATLRIGAGVLLWPVATAIGWLLAYGGVVLLAPRGW